MQKPISTQTPASTIGIVISRYSSNIGHLLNKYVLSNYGYAYPVALTLCHMMACSFISYIAASVMDVVPFQSIQSMNQLVKFCGLQSCSLLLSCSWKCLGAVHPLVYSGHWSHRVPYPKCVVLPSANVAPPTQQI